MTRGDRRVRRFSLFCLFALIGLIGVIGLERIKVYIQVYLAISQMSIDGSMVYSVLPSIVTAVQIIYAVALILLYIYAYIRILKEDKENEKK